ncbi:RNA-directed DNA polymerase from mobile element jockey-like protein [Willisornis vidua]|uniref:RNA-directed DNA polymerase from mobile element jockey-like protein n=1 Tax=Willisornis vidua TaxID=1566151 RepID=A0ABQ9D9X7_9PASS|nr:RNA-directed DNA polymerase from mobile element jockey-like protein [Willisornis vidua]
MNLNLVRDGKDNKKGFYEYIGGKRKTRKNVGTFLNEVWDLATQNMERVEKGKKEDPENYRLVGLTLIPERVMEQITLETNPRDMNNKKITWSGQHGLTKGKGLTNLRNFCGEVTGLVDERRAVHIVHLDFHKAFGTVLHKILINQLLIHELDKQ